MTFEWFTEHYILAISWWIACCLLSYMIRVQHYFGHMKKCLYSKETQNRLRWAMRWSSVRGSLAGPISLFFALFVAAGKRDIGSGY